MADPTNDTTPRPQPGLIPNPSASEHEQILGVGVNPSAEAERIDPKWRRFYEQLIQTRDQLIDAWQRENEARKRPAALDPVRQNLFITVALEALLASHNDGSLRQRTHEAYNRRLARLGLSASAPEGGSDEA